MAANMSDTFLLNCKNVMKKFDENIKKSRNLDRNIKAELELCVKELEEIIIEQNSVINNQKTQFIRDCENLIERQSVENENVNKQLREMNAKLDQNCAQKTYSSVVKQNNIDFIENKRKNLVIIKPKSAGIDSKITRDTTKQLTDKHNINIGVKSVKNLANGGIIIDCSNDNESLKLIEKINAETAINMDAFKPKKRAPKIVIHGVSEDITEVNITKEIVSRNQLIKSYFADKSDEQIESEFKLKFKLRKKAKNNDNSFVFEVSPQLKNKVINSLRNINIGWKACRFADFIYIIRCFKCNGFGHKSDNCNNNETCGLCSEPHSTKECKKDKSEHKCINCERNNNYNNTNKYAVNHSSFHRDCESFKRIKSAIMSKIDNE
jgi:hypothetical protein